MKAETKLRHIKARAANAVTEVNQKWAAKERAYLDTLPEDVRAVLRAAGVLPPGLCEPNKAGVQPPAPYHDGEE